MVKSFYPQVYLKECKYILKEKKTPRYITIDSDKENSCGKDFKKVVECSQIYSKIRKKIKTDWCFG